MAIAMLTTYRDYFLSHFYNFNMRSMSGYDPAGLLLVLTAFLLSSALLIGIIVRFLFPTWAEKHLKEARTGMEQARLRMEENIHTNYQNLQEASTQLRHELKDKSSQQGFVAEMLSFAYLSRLAFALAIFGITAYLNALAAVVAGWRTPNVIVLNLKNEDSGAKTLPDLGHDAFEYVMSLLYGETTYIDWFELPDNFIFAVGTITVSLLVLHPRRLLILRRLLCIFGFINAYRACCVAVTSLPDASPMCISQFNSDRGAYKMTPIFPRAFIRAAKVLARPSQHITCGDMVFSGHTTFFMLCAMIAKTYCKFEELNTPFTRKFPFILWTVRYTVYVLVGMGIFAIIGTRLHYTLDVLIAIFVTGQCWWTYHWYAYGYIPRFPLMAWLECDSISKIDIRAYRFARRTSSFSADSPVDPRVVDTEPKKTK